MCCGDSGGSKTQTVVNKTEGSIPAYIEAGGQEVYDKAKPVSDRDYPLYPNQRLADFSPDTQDAFQMVRDQAGNWKSAYDKSVAATDTANAPVGQADIDAYMNPYEDQVVADVVRQIQEQAGRDKIKRDSSYSKRGSYLSEDRREVLDMSQEERINKLIAQETAKLRQSGFSGALTQANVGKNRALASGQQYLGEAGAGQQLGYSDAAATAGVGTDIQNKDQQNLNLAYEDFMKQFNFPQEKLTWLMSILQGIPYAQDKTTTGQQVIPLPNTFAQNLGAFGALAGGAGELGAGKWLFGP